MPIVFAWEIIEKLRQLAGRGVEYVLLSNAIPTRTTLGVFAREIMPHVGGLPRASQRKDRLPQVESALTGRSGNAETRECQTQRSLS